MCAVQPSGGVVDHSAGEELLDGGPVPGQPARVQADRLHRLGYGPLGAGHGVLPEEGLHHVGLLQAEELFGHRLGEAGQQESRRVPKEKKAF